jgi:hypothetical protein
MQYTVPPRKAMSCVIQVIWARDLTSNFTMPVIVIVTLSRIESRLVQSDRVDFFLTLISRDNIFMAWDGDKTLMLKSMAWVQQLLDQFVECLLHSCEVQDEISSKLRVSSSPRLETVGSFLIKCGKYTVRLSEWVCLPPIIRSHNIQRTGFGICHRF